VQTDTFAETAVKIPFFASVYDNCFLLHSTEGECIEKLLPHGSFKRLVVHREKKTVKETALKIQKNILGDFFLLSIKKKEKKRIWTGSRSV
jgi:hypothetical protein